MGTPDVLKAVDVAVGALRIFPIVTPQELATLTALAAAITAYREALRRRDTELLSDNWHDIAASVYTTRERLLALCRGEKPTTKENNDATTTT